MAKRRAPRPTKTHARQRRQSAEYRSPATLRTNAERSTMPRLFIIASHIVVIVIIMILYRFPLSVGVVAVLFHGSRLVWALGARRSHVQSRKTSVFLAEMCFLCVSCSSCCALRAHGWVTDRRERERLPRQSADWRTYLPIRVYV